MVKMLTQDEIKAQLKVIKERKSVLKNDSEEEQNTSSEEDIGTISYKNQMYWNIAFMDSQNIIDLFNIQY